jgi:hypothetical protein
LLGLRRSHLRDGEPEVQSAGMRCVVPVWIAFSRGWAEGIRSGRSCWASAAAISEMEDLKHSRRAGEAHSRHSVVCAAELDQASKGQAEGLGRGYEQAAASLST